MSSTNSTSRTKRRREHRRLKRNAMQSMMVLRGWVPVQLNAQFGIWHHDTNRLVLRKWYVPDQPPQPVPLPWPTSRLARAPLPPGQGAWRYQCISLSAPFNGKEIAWNDIRLRWVHALRNAAIQMGWM